jgi:cation diffusion facilitator family transporter
MAASSKRALIGAMVANLLIATTKFIVGAITKSTVMIAEGIHSLVDTGNSGLMLLGERRSQRPEDESHPFGYGMELYFWTLVVAMVVFGGGGCLSIYEGVAALRHPRELTSVWLNFLVIAAAAVFEGASFLISLREFAAYRREKRFEGSALDVIRASKNPAIFVTVLEDAAALLGLAIAAAGLGLRQWLDMPQMDGFASILIGLLLMAEAALLGSECRGLIIGEPARPLIVQAIEEVVSRHPELGSLDELRTLQLGPGAILVILRMNIPAALSAAALRDAAARLSAALKKDVRPVTHVLFEVAPARTEAAA